MYIAEKTDLHKTAVSKTKQKKFNSFTYIVNTIIRTKCTYSKISLNKKYSDDSLYVEISSSKKQKSVPNLVHLLQDRIEFILFLLQYLIHRFYFFAGIGPILKPGIGSVPSLVII